jgi:hypothetical protein
MSPVNIDKETALLKSLKKKTIGMFTEEEINVLLEEEGMRQSRARAKVFFLHLIAMDHPDCLNMFSESERRIAGWWRLAADPMIAGSIYIERAAWEAARLYYTVHDIMVKDGGECCFTCCRDLTPEQLVSVGICTDEEMGRPIIITGDIDTEA